jgi:hypothetical protein
LLRYSFRGSEATLRRWSRLHLQSLAPTSVSLSQHDEKHVVPIPLSVQKNKKKITYRISSLVDDTAISKKISFKTTTGAYEISIRDNDLLSDN